MAEPRKLYVDDVLREVWDDDAKVVTKFDSSGVQVEQRAYLPADLADMSARALLKTTESNKTFIYTSAKAAFAGNTTFLAIPAPTAAQAITQTQRLTRQMNALAKIVLGDFSNTSDV